MCVCVCTCDLYIFELDAVVVLSHLLTTSLPLTVRVCARACAANLGYGQEKS